MRNTVIIIFFLIFSSLSFISCITRTTEESFFSTSVILRKSIDGHSCLEISFQDFDPKIIYFEWEDDGDLYSIILIDEGNTIDLLGTSQITAYFDDYPISIEYSQDDRELILGYSPFSSTEGICVSSY